MTPFLWKYLFCWLFACAIALTLILQNRAVLFKEWTIYRRLLMMRWKLALFLPAFIFVTFAGRFTDDETWDIISGGGMSILTYLTAAWAIGVIYRFAFEQRSGSDALLATVLWLFSSSWFYDGYLLLRDGEYTHRWFGNLILSANIYLCAGLLWNLEARSRFPWVGFGFTRNDWPAPPTDQRFLPILFVSIPLILIAAYLLVGFVGWNPS